MGAAPRTALRSRARTVAFRALVVLFALAALIPGYGLADLTTPINPTWHEGYVSEVGYGALPGIILPVGYEEVLGRIESGALVEPGEQERLTEEASAVAHLLDLLDSRAGEPPARRWGDGQENRLPGTI